MNIFFIGPYRQNNFDGILCRNVLSSVASKHNVFARPIYYEGYENISDIDNNIQQLEDKDINNYDCLIQHVKPIHCLHTTQFGKNILIPIIDEEYDYEIFIDHTIDQILLDNEEYCEFGSLSKKSILFDYDLSIEVEKKQMFDIGALNSMKKFYFIGEYKYNYDLIMGLIRSFIYVRSKLDQEYMLAIFVINVNQNEVNLLNNYIQQVYSKYKSPHAINKVIIIPMTMGPEHVIAAHNSGDIFLNFNNQPKTQINTKIAYKVGNRVVDKPKSLSRYLSVNGNISECLHPVISDQDIIDSLINSIIDDQTKSSIDKHKNKTKHIVDLI